MLPEEERVKTKTLKAIWLSQINPSLRKHFLKRFCLENKIKENASGGRKSQDKDSKGNLAKPDQPLPPEAKKKDKCFGHWSFG